MFLWAFRGYSMDLFLREASDRIGDDDVLAKINTLMDWSAF